MRLVLFLTWWLLAFGCVFSFSRARAFDIEDEAETELSRVEGERPRPSFPTQWHAIEYKTNASEVTISGPVWWDIPNLRLRIDRRIEAYLYSSYFFFREGVSYFLKLSTTDRTCASYFILPETPFPTPVDANLTAAIFQGNETVYGTLAYKWLLPEPEGDAYFFNIAYDSNHYPWEYLDPNGTRTNWMFFTSGPSSVPNTTFRLPMTCPPPESVLPLEAAIVSGLIRFAPQQMTELFEGEGGLVTQESTDEPLGSEQSWEDLPSLEEEERGSLTKRDQGRRREAFHLSD